VVLLEGGTARHDRCDPVAPVARRQRRGLAALFDRFHADVYRFLARIASGHLDTIDDLVQTTFLEAYRAAPRFGRRSTVRTWIFGIATNIARHHIRNEGRRRAAMTRAADLPRAAPIQPDELVEQSDEAQEIVRAIAALPEPLRVAYVMCVVEEVPAKEAAIALETREGTLWRRVHEAREALRRMLERTGR